MVTGKAPISRPMRRRRAYLPDAEALSAAAFRSAYEDGPIEEQLRGLHRDLIAKLGGRSWHAHDSRRSDEGWPDEATILRDRLFFVELKAPGKKATDMQRETIAMLNGCRGVQAFVVTSSGDRGRDTLLLGELIDRVLR